MSFEINCQDYLHQLENECFATNSSPTFSLETCSRLSAEQSIQAYRKKITVMTLELEYWRQRVYELEKLCKTFMRESESWQHKEFVEDEEMTKTKFMLTQQYEKINGADTDVSEPQNVTLETKGQQYECVSSEFEKDNESNVEFSAKLYKEVEGNYEHEEARNCTILLTKVFTDLVVEEELERIDFAVKEEELRHTINSNFNIQANENISIVEDIFGGDYQHHGLINLYAANKIVMTNQLLMEWIDQLMNFTVELLHHHQKANSITERKDNECDVTSTFNKERVCESENCDIVLTKEEKLEPDKEQKFEREDNTIIRALESEDNKTKNKNYATVEGSLNDTNNFSFDHASSLGRDKTESQTGLHSIENTENKVSSRTVSNINDKELNQLTGVVHNINMEEYMKEEINEMHYSEDKELESEYYRVEEIDYKHSNLEISHSSNQELVTDNTDKLKEEWHDEDLHESNENFIFDNKTTVNSITSKSDDVTVNTDHVGYRIDNYSCNSNSNEDVSSYEDIDVGFDPFAEDLLNSCIF